MQTIHDRHGQYKVQWVEAYQPGQGVGRQLLFEGLRHATSLRAEYISAVIMNHECRRVMEDVFGADCITSLSDGSDPEVPVAELEMYL